MGLYHNSANMFVAGIIGSPLKNFLNVEVQGLDGEQAVVANADLDPVAVRLKCGSFDPRARARGPMTSVP